MNVNLFFSYSFKSRTTLTTFLITLQARVEYCTTGHLAELIPGISLFMGNRESVTSLSLLLAQPTVYSSHKSFPYHNKQKRLGSEDWPRQRVFGFPSHCVKWQKKKDPAPFPAASCSNAWPLTPFSPFTLLPFASTASFSSFLLLLFHLLTLFPV